MSRDWESVFSRWAKGPSATEQQKAENAERMIREAIRDCAPLRQRNIRVFTQGSYRNRVNVRRDSDVDIGVLCFDTYFPEYPDDNVKARLDESFVPASYTYKQFKNDLEGALVSKFGRAAVTRGSKAFDVKANSYRVEADVAAFFEHRRYLENLSYISGVEMIPDDGNPPRTATGQSSTTRTASEKMMRPGAGLSVLSEFLSPSATRWLPRASNRPAVRRAS